MRKKELFIHYKLILITNSTGSFGKNFIKYVLSNYKHRKLTKKNKNDL